MKFSYGRTEIQAQKIDFSFHLKLQTFDPLVLNHERGGFESSNMKYIEDIIAFNEVENHIRKAPMTFRD